MKPAGKLAASISENRRNYVTQAGFVEKLQRKINEIKGKASTQSPPKGENGDNKVANPSENEPESTHGNQPQQPAKAEEQGRRSGYISRQLAEELSPDRKPHIYGQGFHSESEVRRQREKLIEIARTSASLATEKMT